MCVEKKIDMPLGQVPVLEVDGCNVPLVQSISIARFVAKEVKLAGKDSIEMAMADAVVDTALELFEAFVQKIFMLTMKKPEEMPVKYRFLITSFIFQSKIKIYTNNEGE